MSERRVELILRVPNLSPVRAAQAEYALAHLARQLGGSLSAIERDHYADHARHVARRKIV